MEVRGFHLRKPGGKFSRTAWLIAISAIFTVTIALMHGQTGGNGTAAGANARQDQNIPDAPSTVQPAKPLPTPPTSPEPPPSQNPGQASPAPTPADENAKPAPQTTPQKPPPINLRTVPEGGATKDDGSDQQESFTLPAVSVNQVLVPVTVTDEAGHLVNGLTAKDFGLIEDGKKQKLNFFTSSAFAVSAAVILDLGMKDVDLQKVNHTFPALEGAFSEFDELSVYTYGNTVGQLTGWGAVGPALSQRLEDLQDVRGQNNGPPVVSGPIAGGGPVINGVPVDPGTTGGRPMTAVQPARVMNDAILKAAVDLAKRDKDRRKIIFVISDGREYRSEASFRDVLRVLLSNNIIVYAIGVDTQSFGSLSKLHLPRFGYTDILPKYVNATGGQVLNETTRSGIEDAYSAALGYARNQYTMGYVTHAPPTSQYRSIEVQVDRPSCRSSIRPCINVYARDGYYSAPFSK
jgi:VWFA-related protein